MDKKEQASTEIKQSAAGTAGDAPKRFARRMKGLYCDEMTYGARESFKRLRTNISIAFEGESTSCKVVGITSAQVNEGKSTASINLAYTLAEAGKRVLLIDCDLRRPSVHTKMGISQNPGLADLLTTTTQVGPSVYRYTSPKGVKFDIIPAGQPPQNPSELLSSARFEEVIRTLKAACDYIILDLPPVGAVIDAVAVSRTTDGMIVIIRENKCPRYVLDDCMDQLKYAKARILGFVMNGISEGGAKRYKYNDRKYQYSYRYGPRYDNSHYGRY